MMIEGARQFTVEGDGTGLDADEIQGNLDAILG